MDTIGKMEPNKRKQNDNPVHSDSTKVVSSNCCDTKDDTKDDTSLDNINELNDAGVDSILTTKDESEEQKNDSSNLSTAFTISFENDSPKKAFGIRDSIRKFAPPKPNTIEKPRSKPESQDIPDSSISSAPEGYSKKHFIRSSVNNVSTRSSGQRSDSSRHSNISESAAFLIDKMLNCDTGESLSSIYVENEKAMRRKESKNKSDIERSAEHSGADILEDDIDVDFCEDKSDNGTYIVGAEPESDAARKKIDELFGVVKAAEASIIAASNARQAATNTHAVNRQSRVSERRPINSDRQEYHTSRQGTGRKSSRSSSSSGREINVPSHKSRSASRQSRNSSCDRSSKLPSSRTRRATSQSSRTSSHRGLSDGDTQSSRSSIHTEMVENPDIQTSNHPNMKFNRAFTLRRARLGLGEPSSVCRLISTPTTGQDTDSTTQNVRRAIITPKYGQINNHSGQQNLSRNDGGRYSLRMKNSALPVKTSGLPSGSRVGGQQGAFIDNYISKVYGPRGHSAMANQISPAHQGSHQSIEEHSITSPSRSKNMVSRSNDFRHQRRFYNSEVEGESYAGSLLSCSLYAGQDLENCSDGSMRTHVDNGKIGNQSGQLGALDCLVISAISSLSVKIRSSVCDLMVDHAKKLPLGNETRSIVEEILPQLTANPSRSKSPSSLEEIDQPLYFELAQTLKNLKKIEQMVDVMRLISK